MLAVSDLSSFEETWQKKGFISEVVEAVSAGDSALILVEHVASTSECWQITCKAFKVSLQVRVMGEESSASRSRDGDHCFLAAVSTSSRAGLDKDARVFVTLFGLS